MKKFMDEEFLLQTKTASKLYHDYAENMPIFDYHCHLSPKEIWENRRFNTITELWLGGDHYKWRALRSMGVPEKYITGKETSDYEKFEQWARIMPYLLGNPLYHWTHLELKRYFGIEEQLSEKNAREVYDKINTMLAGDDFTTRALIERSNVYAVCTTDDPADSLEYHAKLKAEGGMKTLVVPAWRPDKALNIDDKNFSEYIRTLADTAEMSINSYEDLLTALKKRILFFNEMGCAASDHAFDYAPYERADEAELDLIFKKALQGNEISLCEKDKYRTELLIWLAKEYKSLNWAMELHIGALRNNNEKLYNRIGPDTGFDSVNDYNYAPALGKLLNSMNVGDNLPKTILFTLNPKDHYVLTTIMGCFQEVVEGSIEGNPISKIQEGSAWWFLDNKPGMETQMEALMVTGVLSRFCGMVTDSRSFISYPRHEYFRRILCNIIGNLVENGEYPADFDTLGKIVKDICFNNAKLYIPIR